MWKKDCIYLRARAGHNLKMKPNTASTALVLCLFPGAGVSTVVACRSYLQPYGTPVSLVGIMLLNLFEF
jgi:hypothetical protein